MYKLTKSNYSPRAWSHLKTYIKPRITFPLKINIWNMSSDSSNNLAKAVAVDTLATKSLVKPNPQRDNAIINSEKKGLPAITVSALQGQYLAIQCQLIGAKTVLEIGTLGGYSTIWFSQAGAKVTSIEINPKHRDVALENTKGLDPEIILGAALDVLPKLAEEGRKFDLVFIDADWGEQWDYFDWAVKLTRAKGCIYVDNVVRTILEDELLEPGKKSLVTKAGEDGRVTATLVSTVNSHKNSHDQQYDGFLLAVVH